jgi:hypothetical protein
VRHHKLHTGGGSSFVTLVLGHCKGKTISVTIFGRTRSRVTLIISIMTRCFSFVGALLLATTTGLKVSAPIGRRAALSIVVAAPAAAFAASNAGTYGTDNSGYQSLPSPDVGYSAPAASAPAAAQATPAQSVLTAGQRKLVAQSKASYEKTTGQVMLPSEEKALEERIAAKYPGYQ